MKKTNSKFTPKIQYIVYGSLMAAFIVWLIIGAQFVTLESPAVVCFFGMSLPFLGAFAALGLIIRVAWKQHRNKKSGQTTTESIADKNK